jgi:hypothetical protein
MIIRETFQFSAIPSFRESETWWELGLTPALWSHKYRFDTNITPVAHLLITDYWSLIIDHWSLIIDHWSLFYIPELAAHHSSYFDLRLREFNLQSWQKYRASDGLRILVGWDRTTRRSK